jgi:hypothetical protein
VNVLRRLAVGLVALGCVAAVIAFQSHRTAQGASDPRVFIPSPAFYENFSPSARVTIADAYWLYAIQYYGEHVKTDQRLDSLPAMIELITRLAPHFKQAYFFGSFAMLDVGRPDLGRALLERGFAANPGDWHFPFYLGFFAYRFDPKQTRDQDAAAWYAKAAQLPGSLPSVLRMAGELAISGHARQKMMDQWAWFYGQGDMYAQQKAIIALDQLLPKEKAARIKVVAALKDFVPAYRYDQFVADVFRGYL